MAGQKFDVLSPLLKDGKRYGPDEKKAKTITLEDPDEIEELACLGVIEVPKAVEVEGDQGDGAPQGINPERGRRNGRPEGSAPPAAPPRER